MDLQKQGKQAKRRADGRFAKGCSGNPAGRPPGLRNRAIRAVETLLDGEAENLTRKAVALALDGNPAALRLCLERLLPTRRDRPVPLSLPALRQAADVGEALDMITAALSAGEITPGEALALGRFVDALLNMGVLRWPRSP
ncbi:MAG TPA: DUF5681 domain-containing protein [Stellaceae bacterium]|nr:DUF5681 domain-containing protein [Stellaceae bacterium]